MSNCNNFDWYAVKTAGAAEAHGILRLVNGKANNLYGGYAAGSGAASGSRVVLFGGEANNVYGGWSADGTTENNKVHLINTKVNGSIYGGNGAAKTGNTLNVYKEGHTVKEIGGFENLNFIVPKSAEGKTMLTVNGGQPTDLKGVNIRAGIATEKMSENAVVTLLNNEDGLITDDTTNINNGLFRNSDAGKEISDMLAEAVGTGLTAYEVSIEKTDANNIVMTVGRKRKEEKLDPDAKSLPETRAAGMAVLNSGADFALGKGLANAQAAAEAENAESKTASGFTPYVAIGGANMRYETGSYVDSKGWGANVGFARILNCKDSKLTLAPFVEYGKANYDSYLDNGTHGNGDNSFTGIGFMAKNEQNNGLYYEGSIRLGRAKGDYNGEWYLGKYDTSSNYLAFHAGIGKVNKLSQKSSIDYYGKLFYTHQNGDDVTVNRPAVGDSFVYSFDAINSCRLRLGTRFTQKLNKTDSVYAGLAWDYEFDSEARAHYNGMATPAPSMKGSSGMLELGWKQEATKDNPFGVDLGLTGWCGKQRGIQFNAGFSFGF